MQKSEEINVPTGLMDYIEKIQSKREEILKNRSKETTKEIDSLISKLSSTKLSKSLIWNQLDPLQTSIKETISDEDFKDMDKVFDGISIKIGNYFNQVDNFMSLTISEANIISECIINLFEIIESLVSRKEELSFGKEEERPEEPELEYFDDFGEEPEEPQSKEKDEEPKAISKLRKMAKKKPEEIEEEIEEEEEVAVSVCQFVFRCLKCGNQYKETFMSGCRKCGEHRFQVIYL